MTEAVFLVFGLGFFLFTIWVIVSSERESYGRRIMESREFGFGDKNQHTTKTLKG